MLPEPNCSVRLCKHFRGVKYLEEGNPSTEVPYCNAFPGGIPREISYGPNKHLEPYPGDNGIQYEKEDESDNSDVE